MFKKRLLYVLLSTLPITTFANPATQVVITPVCLMKNITSSYQILATQNAYSLIKVNDTQVMELSNAKHKQKKLCGGFIDVTEEWNHFESKNMNNNQATTFLAEQLTPIRGLSNVQPDYNIKYQSQVNQLLKQINPQKLWNNLTTLTHFQNRYARSENGKEAANWIKNYIENLARSYARHDVSVYFVDTPGYQQPSVVAKIGVSQEPGVVIGAHMDTLVMFSTRQPGADDDGSGTSTILESARTVLSSGMQFKKPLYFVWYAAEEEGLVGSKYVVNDFIKKKIPVAAVAQFDMTGFTYKNDPTVWLLDDNVNSKLTAYFETLVKTYVKQPVGHTRCGYGCSDHASWTNRGFAAAAPFEAKYGTENKAIHTTGDTMEKLSLTHMTNFAKLATAFAVETAEPLA